MFALAFAALLVACGGSGQAAALNGDGSFNSPQNPAARGSAVVLFGTGGGTLDQAFPDGKLTGRQLMRVPGNVSATIGGRPAAVEYAGSAPGLVNGALQFNLRVPADAPSGSAVPVVINVNGTGTRNSVTLALK